MRLLSSKLCINSNTPFQYPTLSLRNFKGRDRSEQHSTVPLYICIVQHNYLLYLCPSLPVEHRTDSSPSHSVLGCSGHSGPVGPLLCIISLRDGDSSLPRWVFWLVVVDAFVNSLFMGRVVSPTPTPLSSGRVGPALVASYDMHGRAVGLFYTQPTGQLSMFNGKSAIEIKSLLL